jgi:short subunit dehydrogenase-like uncharacterized protein
MARDLDFLVYGATGYVGRRAARLLIEQLDGARVGLAGRNPTKLEALQAELGGGEVVIADSAEPSSVHDAVARAPVVLACAGPFVRMGTPVVEGCVQHGTHYVDITGETHWVHGLIERFHEEARKNGTFIVPFAGYDSIPSDLCTWLCVKALREDHDQGTRRVVSAMFMKGGMNGGTGQTMLAMFDHPAHQALMEDPFVLCPDFDVGDEEREARRDRPGVRRDLDGVPRAPFFMARINSRVVYRSSRLFASTGAPYGSDFFYDELMDLGRSRAGLKGRIASGLMRATEAGLSSSALRPLIAKAIPSSGQGPTEEQIVNGFTRSTVVGEGERGARVRAVLRYEGDPGNALTASCLVASARCLAEDGDKLGTGEPGRGGLLTPSFAMGEHLAGRLRDQGVSLELNGD